jgi:hypothetical protein
MGQPHTTYNCVVCSPVPNGPKVLNGYNILKFRLNGPLSSTCSCLYKAATKVG